MKHSAKCDLQASDRCRSSFLNLFKQVRLVSALVTIDIRWAKSRCWTMLGQCAVEQVPSVRYGLGSIVGNQNRRSLTSVEVTKSRPFQSKSRNGAWALTQWTHRELYTEGLIKGRPIPSINLLCDNRTSNSARDTSPRLSTPAGNGSFPSATLTTSRPVVFRAVSKNPSGMLVHGC